LDSLFFTGACLLIGALAGFLGGLLGIGGGIVIVPALILLLDQLHLMPVAQVTPVAVATSLACVIFVSISAALAQLRSGQVDWIIARRWVVGLMGGGLIAGQVAVLLPMPVFRACIGVFLVFVSVVMLTQWRPAPHRSSPGVMGSSLLGLAGGFISSIAGIGGGNVIVPTLVYLNVPVHRATATSSALGLPVALAGSVGYYVAGRDLQLAPSTWGYVFLPAFGAIVLSAIATAPLGVRAAAHIAPLPLRRVFGGVLALVAARMLWSAMVR
jgi:uncharacterized membrane protein YfcA